MKLLRTAPFGLVILCFFGGCSDSGQSPATSDTNSVASETTAADDAVASESAETVAQVGKLAIGDPAPPIQALQFIKGEAMDGLQSGQVYVVEFWATWCGPCISTMPHLAGLQTAYGDKVKFIGVTQEEESVVKGFLEREQSAGKTWDEVITYAMALDTNDELNRSYMKAAGQAGIPCAFIVGRDGKVEWIGHPAAMDSPLQQIVEGTYDRDAAMAALEAEEKAMAARQQISAWLQEGDFDKAIGAIDEMLKNEPESASLYFMKAQVLEIAGRNDDSGKAYADAVTNAWDSAEILDAIAWKLATDSKSPDLDVALKAARRASELTEDADSSVLDTLARVYFEQGNVQEALAWQNKAVAAAPGQQELQVALKEYEEAIAAQKSTTDAKPADAKPADAKPADAKPAEEKPADAKPAEEKPADAKPAEEKSVEEKPADEEKAE